MLRIKCLKAIGYLSLWAEQITLAGWRFAGWVMLFFGLWTLEIPSGLGKFTEISAPMIFAAGAAFFGWRDFRHFKRPNLTQAARRIEIFSAARHRPLSELGDAPAIPADDSAMALWRRETARRTAQLSRLKAFWPAPLLAQRDPYALRLCATLLFICGFLTAGPNAGTRIMHGLWPFTAPSDGERLQDISLIITPPAYTRVEKTVLGDANKDEIRIPVGSVIKILVRGEGFLTAYADALTLGQKRISLGIPGKDNDKSEARVAEATYNGETEISLRAGPITLARWRTSPIADAPPKLEITGEAKILPQGQIQVPVKVFDDYGVMDLRMHMRLKARINMVLGKEITQTRSVMSPPQTPFEISPVFDLTAHPWVGMAAIITLTASDQAGHISKEAEFEVTLPERPFRQPLAHELIDMRKSIIRAPMATYEPHYLLLEGFLHSPPSFTLDRITRQALRVTSARMGLNPPSPGISQSLIDLMWDTALHLEDGRLSLSARNLQEAQAALQAALQDPKTTEAELARLMQDVREAMQDYMQALAQDMQRRMESGEGPAPLPPELSETATDMAEALARMMDQMEAEAMAGNKEAAQKLLSQLQRFMDMANPSGTPSLPKDLEAMMEGMEALREITQEQEKLASETQKQADLLSVLKDMGFKNEGRKPPPFMHSADSMKQQEGLREKLSGLIEKLKSAGAAAPESLEDAQSSMRSAAQALGRSAPDTAYSNQQDALEKLKQSQESMAQAAAQRMKGLTGMPMFSASAMRRDPLGRPMGPDGRNGMAQDQTVKIPAEDERKRLREIVDELRRRSSERDRPAEELEYYRRLLKRF